MVLDCDTYRINMPAIEGLLKDKDEAERNEQISSISLATSVPIIVVCYYVGELYGFNPNLLERIASLRSFYNIKDVLNVKEGITHVQI